MTVKWNGEFHPACLAYPPIIGEAWDKFLAHIEKNGLQHPIELLPDGKLLDGRNRLNACKILGIEPQFVEVNPESPTDYVIGNNERHREVTKLPKHEQAEIARKIEQSFKVEAEARMKAGVAANPVPDSGTGSKSKVENKSETKAAQAVGISRSTLQKYNRIKDDPSKEAKEAFNKIESKEWSINKAYILLYTSKPKDKKPKKPPEIKLHEDWVVEITSLIAKGNQSLRLALDKRTHFDRELNDEENAFILSSIERTEKVVTNLRLMCQRDFDISTLLGEESS